MKSDAMKSLECRNVLSVLDDKPTAAEYRFLTTTREREYGKVTIAPVF